MVTTIGFDTVKAYLDGLLELSGLFPRHHGTFWRVDYDTFKDGTVPEHAPVVTCQNAPIPIIDKVAPEKSPFYLILTDTNGWCGIPQMPFGGPFITDDNLQIPLANNTIVTGKQVREDLALWLKNGFPKEPTIIPTGVLPISPVDSVKG